jgi:hypothetical protein
MPRLTSWILEFLYEMNIQNLRGPVNGLLLNSVCLNEVTHFLDFLVELFGYLLFQ